MNKIKKIPDSVVKLIAAGEVIHDPTDAIKELLENSLDAQATQIQIFLKKAGQEEIVVVDNGQGMSQADLSLATKDYTSSKLWGKTDLNQVQTLGFRGEALASLRKLGQLSIKTRAKNQKSGFWLNDQGQIKPTGLAFGTRVCLKNLFAHLPARQKFLTGASQQLTKIVKLISQFALVNPQTEFKLVNDHKILLKLKPQSLKDRVKKVLGHTNFSQLLEFQLNQPHLQVQGWLGRPGASSTGQQFLFINGRPVQHQALVQAVRQGYRRVLEQPSQPDLVLMIKLPASLIDVNLNPQKTKIKLINQEKICKTLTRQLEDFFDQLDLASRVQSPQQIHNFGLELADQAQQTVKQLKKAVQNYQLGAENCPIFQLNKLYLVLSLGQDLVIIDQHAASEKIMFEQLKKSFEKQQKPDYKLPKPLIIELSLAQTQLIKDQLDIFAQLGIKISHFHDQTFKISHIPQLLNGRDLKKIVKQVLLDFEKNNGRVDQIDQASLQIIEYLACRLAIKAGQELSIHQRQQLVKQLFALDAPFTCPHGRPTTVKLSTQYLEKLFKR